MTDVLSPVMSHIVKTTIEAAGFKEKLSQQIERCRKRLPFLTSSYRIAETKFELAELLTSRDDPGDWKEAGRHYDDVLKVAPYGYIRSAAQISKAELSIRSTSEKELDEAIAMAEKGRLEAKKLVEANDFFIIKATVIEADLRAKRRKDNDINTAIKLYDQVLRQSSVHPYYRARAIVGQADLIYAFRRSVPKKEILLCHEVYYKLLKDKPNDYFAVKGQVLEGELRAKRGGKGDHARAKLLYKKVIQNDQADLDLRARAKLDLADISPAKEALQLINEVLKLKGIDTYILERARKKKEQVTGWLGKK